MLKAKLNIDDDWTQLGKDMIKRTFEAFKKEEIYDHVNCQPSKKVILDGTELGIPGGFSFRTCILSDGSYMVFVSKSPDRPYIYGLGISFDHGESIVFHNAHGSTDEDPYVVGVGASIIVDRIKKLKTSNHYKSCLCEYHMSQWDIKELEYRGYKIQKLDNRDDKYKYLILFT